MKNIENKTPEHLIFEFVKKHGYDELKSKLMKWIYYLHKHDGSEVGNNEIEKAIEFIYTLSFSISALPKFNKASHGEYMFLIADPNWFGHGDKLRAGIIEYAQLTKCIIKVIIEDYSSIGEIKGDMHILTSMIIMFDQMYCLKPPVEPKPRLKRG